MGKRDKKKELRNKKKINKRKAKREVGSNFSNTV
jgi:hypothetical protein